MLVSQSGSSVTVRSVVGIPKGVAHVPRLSLAVIAGSIYDNVKASSFLVQASPPPSPTTQWREQAREHPTQTSRLLRLHSASLPPTSILRTGSPWVFCCVTVSSTG